jgi:hypothetical protein
MVERFRAAVQYNTWIGTAAADDPMPSHPLQKMLEENQLIHEGEFLIAVSLWVGENHDGKLGSVFIDAYMFTGANTPETIRSAIKNINGAIPVRKVRLDLSITTFLALFKRFDLVLTKTGFDLEGRDYIEAP